MSVKQYEEQAERNKPKGQLPFANAPYKDAKKGSTITFTLLRSLIEPKRTLRRPVLGAEGKETTALQNVNGRVTAKRPKDYKNLDAEVDMLNPDKETKRPQAEEAMIELHNLALMEYRNYIKEGMLAKGVDEEKAVQASRKIKFEDNASGRKMKYWGVDSQGYGSIVAMKNGVVPFEIKSESFDPTNRLMISWADQKDTSKMVGKLKGGNFVPTDVEEIIKTAQALLGNDAHNWDKLAKAENNVKLFDMLPAQDALIVLKYFNRGISQFYDEIHEVEGKRYFKYPKFLTEITLTAQDSVSVGFDYLAWRPSAHVHEDYQTMIPAEYGGYLWVHPDDVDSTRGYFSLPKEQKRAMIPPRIREYPDPETGKLVVVSWQNPELPPIAVMLYDGPASEIFSKPLVEAWKNFPDYHLFKPSNQTTLAGGCYFDMPEIKYSFDSRFDKQDHKIEAVIEQNRIYPTPADLQDAFIKINPDGEPVVWVNEDGSVAVAEPEKAGQNQWAVLKWDDGCLWEKPLNLNRADQNMNLVLGNREVVDKIKAEADRLGVPYHGKDKPVFYDWLKDHPLHEKMVEYHRKNIKTSSIQDDSDDGEEVPAENKRGAKTVI